MTDDIKKPEDEIAALKARVEELERANKPPAPYVPEPYQPYDPTANMTMPPSALAAMLAAEPRGFMQGVVHDNRAPNSPSTIPSSQTSSNVRGTNVPGSGTGWAHETPLGPPPGVNYVDRLMDAQDAKDKAAALAATAPAPTEKLLEVSAQLMAQQTELMGKLMAATAAPSDPAPVDAAQESKK